MLKGNKFKLKGMFHVEHIRNGKVLNTFKIKNGIVNEGLTSLLDIMFHDETQIPLWYIGLIDNAGFSALAAADTMSSHSGWTETVPYSDANRITWATDAASAESITNGTPVTFTINATAAIYGLFIVSDNTKSGTSGTLWSTADFASVINVTSGDQLKVTYTVNASSA